MPKKKFSLHLTSSTNYILYGSLFVFVALCIVGLAAVILTAYYGVPVGDDYLAIKTYSNHQTWLNETLYSVAHTGRYLQSVTASVAYGALRSHIAVMLPALTLIWTYVLIYLYGRLVADKLRLRYAQIQLHLISGVTLLLVVTSGRVVDPNGVWFLYQPFYFSSAIVTYTICALLYSTLFYAYAKNFPRFKKRPILSLGIFFTLTYLLGLYNETTPATLFGLSVIGILLSYLYKRREITTKYVRHYLFALAGSSILALVTMYLSPASIARRHVTGAMQAGDIVSPIITKTLTALMQYTFRPIDFALIVIFALLLYVFLFKKSNLPAKLYAKFMSVGALTLFASILSLFAAITLLVMGYGPYTSLFPRTFLIVQILFVAGALALSMGLIGVVLGSIPRKFSIYGSLLVYSFVLVILLVAAPKLIERYANDISGVIAYHATWEHQDALLKESAATKPNETIYLDDSGAGIGDGFSVRCSGPYSQYTLWLTDGMEAYYGVREICSISDLKENE